MINRFRRGFEEVGGASNFAQPETSVARGPGWLPKLKATTLGVAAMFIPISLVQATGALWFEGGGRMLLATDIDTLVIDATILFCLVVVWRRRWGVPGGAAYGLYTLLLAIASTVLIAYIVTNFGTLFRLRLMAAYRPGCCHWRWLRRYPTPLHTKRDSGRRRRGFELLDDAVSGGFPEPSALTGR